MNREHYKQMVGNVENIKKSYNKALIRVCKDFVNSCAKDYIKKPKDDERLDYFHEYVGMEFDDLGFFKESHDEAWDIVSELADDMSCEVSEKRQIQDIKIEYDRIKKEFPNMSIYEVRKVIKLINDEKERCGIYG